MNYQESRAYIEKSQEYGSVLGLDNMRELMNRLGNPQDRLSYVHVAGTNGKGSVIAYLYSVLSRAGYRVGRYVSPTIYSYRERMEVDGKKISRDKFSDYISRIAKAIDDMTQEGLSHPTPFEIETAAAFLYFKEENCDLVLLEVGMGGDLDATNLIRTTKLAVLVSISMDHMSFLGNTPGEIAEKKAGIVKPGCRVVTAMQKPDVMEVIEQKCQSLQVPLTVSGGNTAEILSENYREQTFRYKDEIYEIHLAGVYQKENAVLALDALEILEELGYPTSLLVRKEGLKEACWGGRFTVLHEKPLFVVDGAHNPAAAEMLAASIEHYFKEKRLIYIMGMFRDKDYDSVIQKTVPYADQVLTIQTPENPRALPAEELAQAVGRYHRNVHAAASLEEAVREAFCLASLDDVIIAFGSLSFIGDMTRIVEEADKK